MAKLYLKESKKFRSEWKNTGRVSKKYSEKLWSEFKSKTNNYFEKFKNKNKSLNDKEIKIIKEQKELYKKLKERKNTLNSKKI